MLFVISRMRSINHNINDRLKPFNKRKIDLNSMEYFVTKTTCIPCALRFILFFNLSSSQSHGCRLSISINNNCMILNFQMQCQSHTKIPIKGRAKQEKERTEGKWNEMQWNQIEIASKRLNFAMNLELSGVCF